MPTIALAFLFLLFLVLHLPLHISPRDNIEAMALKHLAYEVGEHTMEKMVVIDTVVPLKLPRE